jgi:hypothetical protein
VEAFVKITFDPLHTTSGAALKSAIRLHPARDTAKVFTEPSHRDALRSLTVTLPLVDPKLTVIWLFSGPAPPDVIVAPAGTVHV